MAEVQPIDKEISRYLDQLNNRQKQAVLSVVKTFAEKEEYDYWEDSSFVSELDKRTDSFLKGKAKTYTLDELEEGARKIKFL